MNSRLRALPGIEAHAPFTIRVSGDAVTRAPVEADLPPEPWNRSHFAALATAQLLVAALLIGAWVAVSDELVFTRQVPQLDVAVIATMAGGVANLLWIAHGRAAVRRRKANVLRQVGVVLPATLAGNQGQAPSPAAVGTGLELVAAARMTRYHRPDCPLVDGKPVHPISSPSDTGRRPCGLCRPTGESASGEEVGHA
jgi:hypothetical protein